MAASGQIFGVDLKTSVIVVGTYDGALLGLGADEGRQVFGYAPHIGCVKSVSVSKLGRLASGGTDHTVRLFDLGRSVELGELQEHDDSVACVEFWGTTTLVTGGDDGQVAIWRTSDWELLLKFRAHKAAVVTIAVHPSGRLMASAGRDGSVRLWDLTRGTSAAHLSLEGDPCEMLSWSEDGSDVLAVLGPRELLGVHAKTGEVVTFRDPSSQGFTRITLSAVLVLDGRSILLGDGRGDLRVLELPGAGSTSTGMVETCRLACVGARGRAKALVRGGSGDVLNNGWFAAGFSTGRVEIWHCSPASATSGSGAPGLERFTLLTSVETEVRLTCLAVYCKQEDSEAAAPVVSRRSAKREAAKVAPAAKVAEDTAAADAREPPGGGRAAKRLRAAGARVTLKTL